MLCRFVGNDNHSYKIDTILKNIDLFILNSNFPIHFNVANDSCIDLLITNNSFAHNCE